jgi:hypothetical protein
MMETSFGIYYYYYWAYIFSVLPVSGFVDSVKHLH